MVYSSAVVFVGLLGGCVLCQEGVQPQSGSPQCSLAVEAGARFEPGSFRIELQVVGLAEPRAIGWPIIQFQRMRAEGGWDYAYGAPGGVAEDGVGRVGTTAVQKREPVLMRPGVPLVMWSELSDWRVVGYTGTYRARVLGSIEGVGSYVSSWVEFEVGVAGPDSTDLAEAAAEGGAAWRAYKSFMNSQLTPLVIEPERIGTAGQAEFLTALVGSPHHPAGMLRGMNLPDAVRARLDFLKVHGDVRIALANAQLDERQQRMQAAAANCATLSASSSGWMQAFAAAQHVLLMEYVSDNSEWSVLRSAAADNANIVAVLWEFPEARRLIIGP